MFVRSEIKAEAKEVLRKYYWVLFLVCLLLTLIGGNVEGFKLEWNQNNLAYQDYNGIALSYGFLGYRFYLNQFLNLFHTIFTLIAFVVAIGFKFFIANPLSVGCWNYIKNACQDHQNGADILRPFNEYYWNAVVTLILRDLSIFLWTLLLVVPGIMKVYSYRFVPYLLEDEPNLEYGEILRKSAEMTRGMKMELFVLDLSFIGWYLLNAVTFNLAGYFIHPYANTAKTLVYLHTRERRDYYA